MVYFPLASLSLLAWDGTPPYSVNGVTGLSQLCNYKNSCTEQAPSFEDGWEALTRMHETQPARKPAAVPDLLVGGLTCRDNEWRAMITSGDLVTC